MEHLDKYADLLLEIGIALRPGQNLIIQTEPVHANFAYHLEENAYKMGARYVQVELFSPKSKLSRSNYSRQEDLDYLPDYMEMKLKGYAKDGWSMIFLGGKEDLNALQDLNQENHAIIHKTLVPLMNDLIMARTNGTCTWTIGNLPTAAWARSMWPESSENDEAIVDRLWQEMIPILRLDRDDPAEEWRENSRRIHQRADILNQADLDHLHFTGPGTDLKTYLTPHSKFIGGAQTGKFGQAFTPNLPTEEFFTTPDYRKTEGRARITRPVNVLGVNVHGAWFEFKGGKVVDYGADQNKDRLDAYFKLDEKARYLGEVALVDCSSPIYQSNLVFNDILFDENAACHIALGRGISMAFPEVIDKSAEELDELGCNYSTLHTDFMIGSEELNVKAVKKDGGEMEVIRNGLFVI